jgi:hypothetical protein
MGLSLRSCKVGVLFLIWAGAIDFPKRRISLQLPILLQTGFLFLAVRETSGFPREGRREGNAFVYPLSDFH